MKTTTIIIKTINILEAVLNYMARSCEKSNGLPMHYKRPE